MADNVQDQISLLVKLAQDSSNSSAINAMIKDVDRLEKAFVGVVNRINAGPSIGKVFSKVNTPEIKASAQNFFNTYKTFALRPLQAEFNKLFAGTAKESLSAAKKLQRILTTNISSGKGIPSDFVRMARFASAVSGGHTYGMTGPKVQADFLRRIQSIISGANIQGKYTAGPAYGKQMQDFVKISKSSPNIDVLPSVIPTLAAISQAKRASAKISGRGSSTSGGMMNTLSGIYGPHFADFVTQRGLSGGDVLDYTRKKKFDAEFKKYVASLDKAGDAHIDEAKKVKGATGKYDPKTDPSLFGLLGGLSRRRVLPQVPGFIGESARKMRNILGLFGYGPAPGGGPGYGGPMGMLKTLGAGTTALRLGLPAVGLAASGIGLAGGFMFKEVSTIVGRGFNFVTSLLSNLVTKVIGVLGVVYGIKSIVHGIELANQERVGKFVTQNLVGAKQPKFERALDAFERGSLVDRGVTRDAMNQMISMGATLEEAITIAKGGLDIAAVTGKNPESAIMGYFKALKFDIQDEFKTMTGIKAFENENPLMRNARYMREVGAKFGGGAERVSQVNLLGKISQQIDKFWTVAGDSILGVISSDLKNIIGVLLKVNGLEKVSVGKDAQGKDQNIFQYFFGNMWAAFKSLVLPQGSTKSFTTDPLGAMKELLEGIGRQITDTLFAVIPGVLNISMVYEIEKWKYIFLALTGVAPKLGIALARGALSVWSNMGAYGNLQELQGDVTRRQALIAAGNAPGASGEARAAGHEAETGKDNFGKQVSISLTERMQTVKDVQAKIDERNKGDKDFIESLDISGEISKSTAKLQKQFNEDMADPNNKLKVALKALPTSALINLEKTNPQAAGALYRMYSTVANTASMLPKALAQSSEDVTNPANFGVQGGAAFVNPDPTSLYDAMGRPVARGSKGGGIYSGGVYGPYNSQWGPGGITNSRSGGSMDRFADTYVSQAQAARTKNNIGGLANADRSPLDRSSVADVQNRNSLAALNPGRY